MVTSNIVKDNKRLRLVIKSAMSKKRISNRSLSLKTGVCEASLSRFLVHGNTERALSEEGVLKVCKALKIKVELTITYTR